MTTDINNKKLSKSRQKKEKIVAKISEKVGKAKAMVFTNYQGMTHIQLEKFKKALKPTQAELVVTKNTLLEKALQTSNFKLLTSNFQEPTATLFAYADLMIPLKELAKVIKLLNLPKIKSGILDGKTLSADEVLKLATLPSREILIAQLVTGMKAPLFGLHRSLNWNIQKLVMTLSAIQQKKS
ncbi:MAG: 50S ribosomal protein L10 [Patescibacteria group bacterium]